MHYAPWTFCILTFGCKVNQYESQSVREAWQRMDGADSYELAQGDQLVMAAGTYSHPDRGTPFDEVNREYTGEEKRNRIRIGLKNRNGSTRGGR